MASEASRAAAVVIFAVASLTANVNITEGASPTPVYLTFVAELPADLNSTLSSLGASLLNYEARIAFAEVATVDPQGLIAHFKSRPDVAGAYVPADGQVIANQRFCGINHHVQNTGCVVACAASPLSSVSDPNDPIYHSTCGLSQWQAQWGARMVNLSSAWNDTRGSRAIVVAVLDSGVDGAHADLAGALAPGYNFFDNSNDMSDPSGHGTFVTGILAANIDNEVGTAGSAGATVMPLKVCSPGCRPSAVARAMVVAAASGAQVISMSIEVPSPSDQAVLEEAEVVWRAIEFARTRGAIVVAASGNSGEWREGISYPASHPRVLSVGAVAQDKARPLYSSYGEGLDIVAPGGAEPETGIASTLVGGNGFGSGTSFAAPFVSGAAALIFSAHPTWSGTQVGECMLKSASALGEKKYYGFGLIDAGRALSQCRLGSDGEVVLVDPVSEQQLTSSLIDTWW